MCPSLRTNKTIFFSSVEGPLLQGGHKSCSKKCCGLGKLPICQVQHFRKQISILATEFTQQNLGMDDFLFTCIVVPMPQHGNEISTSLCRNFIPTSLSGNEIPTKWHWNEIPTNCLWELYTIYNPATGSIRYRQAGQ